MRALEYLFNFKTNKAALGSVNQDVKNLRQNITGIGGSFDKVHKELTRFARSQQWLNITNLTKNVFGGMVSVAGNVKRAFTATFNFMDQFAAEGDKIAKSARLVGMSVKDFQAFSFAADRSGIAMEAFNSGLQRFSVVLGKAQSGDKTATSIFESLLPEDLSSYKDEREIILAMADSYEKLSESQRNFVSQQVFGRTGLQFGNLLGAGSEEVEKLLNRYEELGGGIGEEAAARAETFKDQLTDIRVTLNSLRVLVGAELMPVFNELFDSFTNYFLANRDEIRKTMRDFGTSIVGSVKTIIPRIPSLIDGFAKIVKLVADIVDYIGPIKTVIGVGIISSLGTIVTIVTSLVGLLGGPTVAIIGAIGVGLVSWGIAIKSVIDNAGLIKSCFIDILNSIESGFVDFFGWLSDGLEDAIGSGIMNGFRKAVKSVPVLGSLLFDDVEFETPTDDIGGQFADMMSSKSTTTTNRFSVDFKNMPRGVKVSAPKTGDFDYSYGYVLDGGV